jgi:hypothetical protein
MNRDEKIVLKMVLTIFRVRWTFAETVESGDWKRLMNGRLNHQKTLYLCIIGLAIAARLGAVWILLNGSAADIYTYEHGEIARNLCAGKGFSVELLGTWGVTSQQAPLVPYLLAGCYGLMGVGTAAAHWLFLGIQSVQGGVMVAATMALAGRVIGKPKWTLFTGLMVAIYPTLVYSATHVQVVSTATMLLVCLFVALFDLRQSPTKRNAIHAGLIMGLMTLTDPILALAGVGTTLAWLIFDRPEMQSQRVELIKAWAVLVLVSVLTISPWIVRNAVVHGRFVFIKSTFGYAFWQGNNKLSVGTDKVMRDSVKTALADTSLSMNERLWMARHEAGCVDDIALTKMDKLELGQLPEVERSAELFRRVRQDLSDEPGRYLELCLRRLRFFLWVDESNPKTAVLYYRIPHISLTIFSLMGLIVMDGGMRRRLAMVMIAFLLTTIFHALTITAPRFHLPWEPLMMIWAVAGASSLCVTNRDAILKSGMVVPQNA